MVHCRHVTFIIAFEHWEIHDPQWSPRRFISNTQLFTRFQTQCAQRFSHDFGRIGTEQNDIASLRLSTLDDGLNDLFSEEFRYRRLDTFHTRSQIIHFQPCQAFRAVNSHKCSVFINLFTGQSCATWDAQCSHAAFWIVRWTRENFEIDVFQQIRHVHQLHWVTQIWLV
ncbi:Uncharacterised protein [Vibrio cholerae]|uniref:Uncharacterized protein n=1 Tax=Vibrio cholerae TaxID=666 RepID=A0A655UMZ0_VIBCL|nr:Uncharacterised protein [Vibrio cholerae]